MAKTDSMKYASCPYERKKCIYQNNYQTVLSKAYETRTLSMGYDRRRGWRLANNDGCYYEVFAVDVGENYNFNAEPEATYYINMTVSFSNATVYLNNGTDFYNAADQVTVIYSPFVQFYTYKAQGNKIYPIVAAGGDNPSANITLLLWRQYNETALKEYFDNNWTSVYDA